MKLDKEWFLFFIKHLIKLPLLEFKKMILEIKQIIFGFFQTGLKTSWNFVNKTRLIYAFLVVITIFIFISGQLITGFIFFLFTIITYIYKVYSGGQIKHQFRKEEEEEILEALDKANK